MQRRAAAAVVAVVTASMSLACGGEHQVEARGAEAPRSILVATTELAPGVHAQTLPAKIGVLEAAERRQLSFEALGKLEWIAEEGTAVGRDDVVARLEGKLERTRVRQAELMLEEARKDQERKQGLRETGAVSSKELDDARTNAEMRQTELDIATEQLAKRELRPGISGFITDTRTEVGESVQPQAPVVVVVSLETLKLVVGVPGYQVGQVRKGAAVEVTIPAVPDETFAGEVTKVAAAAEPGRHLFEVEIRVENPPSEAFPTGRIRPGMSAWARIVVREVEQALRVPLSAMVQRDGSRVVFFVEQNVARAFRVDDALISGETLIIADADGPRTLVVKGQHDLSDGIPVRIDNSVLALGGAE